MLSERSPELQHVWDRADHRPFATHLLHPAQQEVPIEAALLALAKDRLDDRFAPGVEVSVQQSNMLTPILDSLVGSG